MKRISERNPQNQKQKMKIPLRNDSDSGVRAIRYIPLTSSMRTIGCNQESNCGRNGEIGKLEGKTMKKSNSGEGEWSPPK